jgi:two-component system catabolic regulation response regulator CreB
VLEAEKHENFDVVEAATGAECLKLFDAKGPFDLVILDVGLPDIDGYDVCKGLRNVDKRVPIVFVTARSEMRDFSQGREAGSDSYIVKPIARGALRSMVTLFTSVGRKKDEEGAGVP